MKRYRGQNDVAQRMSRRALLGGLGAVVSGAALADAPGASRRPLLRPDTLGPATVPDSAALVAGAGLSGKIAFVVADARNGEILEVRNGLLRLPPASVTKTITAQYALEALGPAHRFATRLLANGPLVDGRLDGDLILLGGGDATLDTDGLVAMAVALKAAGLREVAGRFLVHGGALPRISRIDPGEPDYLAYNAAVSGLNLNYNRVYFEWKREGADYSWTMDARSDNFRPAVKLAQMSIVDRASPVFDYSQVAGGERWTVARAALGERGARWLPVRQPELYAGEVFQIMARRQGIALASPTLVAVRPQGRVLVERKSAPLAEILLGMLKNSNNLTAEITGLSASLARGAAPDGLAASGGEMARWMGARLGARRARFVDHSGLGQDNSLSARDMVSALLRIGPDSTLAAMLARVSLRKKLGEIDAGRPAQVWAKTGTLDYVSALAGFVVPQNGRTLAFAVFSADLERRRATSEAERAFSRGAESWEARARGLQRQLLGRWVAEFG